MSTKKSILHLLASGLVAYSAYNFYRSDLFYKTIVMPIAHKFEPEKAHELSILAFKSGLLPKLHSDDPPCLMTKLHHLKFYNPVGLAAGFDKSGEIIYPLTHMGFGFIEIGSITPTAQPGNEKPRIFRLPKNKALINRYGFNNDGHDVVYDRLKNFKSKYRSARVIGINLGKNKDSEDAVSDYVKGIEKFGDLADYFVINISSPNTPGLQELQKKEYLENLLSCVLMARNKLEKSPAPLLLLKLSPDLSTEEKIDIANIINLHHCRVDGLIISNTTVHRSPILEGQFKDEVGGLSGEPLFDKSTKMISEMYILTKGLIPIIGVGGIFSGKDAYEKIKAGATLVQLYTSFAYHGPPIVKSIINEIHDLLREDNFVSISEAVGSCLK